MDESERRYKWGKYGVGKYVYQKEQEEDITKQLSGYMERFFPQAKLEYFT